MEREELISLVGRITSLRAEVARLTEAQRELRGLERQLDIALKGEEIPADSNGSSSLNERILMLLDSRPERIFTAEDVQHEIPSANLNSTRSVLARLASLQQIARAGRGKYRSNVVKEQQVA